MEQVTDDYNGVTNYPLQDPVVLLVTLPHESVQMVMVHVPISGRVWVCVVHDSCPVGTHAGRPGMAGMEIGEVGLGVAERVKAIVGARVGVRVSVSVGVSVLVSVMVLVEVGVTVKVGVDVRVEVGVGANVFVGVLMVFFRGPQADRTRLNPKTRMIKARFPVFIVFPPSIFRPSETYIVNFPTIGLSASQVIQVSILDLNPLIGYEWLTTSSQTIPPETLCVV